MNVNAINQVLPYIAWLIALVELIIGLYVLVLNAWHTANRHTSALILLVAANSFAIGLMLDANSLQSAYIPAMILATTTIAIEPLLLLSTIALLKPEWLSGRLRWLWWPFYALVLLPTILTILDITLNTNLWFTGINPGQYSGGFLILDGFTQGKASYALQMANYAVITAITIALLFYLAVFNRKATKSNRKLAWMLLAVTFLAGFIQAVVAQVIEPALAALLTSLIFALAYSYVCFSQMISERRMQRGSLQLRLTALILAISLPLMIAITIFLTSRAEQLIGQYTLAKLRNANQVISTRVNSWQEFQERTLKWLIEQPGITSMDPDEQAPILQNLARAFPEISLISISDLHGITIARSDGGSQRNYSQLTWFQESKSGKPVTYATLIDSSSNKPVQVISAPVRGNLGDVIGVCMFSTDPETINQYLQKKRIGEDIYAIVLNDKNQVIASNPPRIDGFQDTDTYLLTSSIRNEMSGSTNNSGGKTYQGSTLFRDTQGKNWRTDFNLMDNGWSVILLTPESTLSFGLRQFQRVAWAGLFIVAILLLVLSWLTIHQAIQPIHTLTDTATAIANGDLTRVVMVETDDEIGVLARTFNSMTSQLRELIANLEHRVSDRTRDLERRAMHLQVAADVSKEASAIQEQEQLLDHTVQLISKRFNFYHAGIFLIDSARKSAVLRAASSEGGRRMLARGHKLEVGKMGIVGFVAGSGTPRIAHDVGTDAVFFNNPDLPQTRSELALPLNVRGKIIGVLDVQSTKPAAFSEEDVTTLQILADQVALAIDNSHLISETNQALQELRNLYAIQVGEAWRKNLGNRSISYSYNRHNPLLIESYDSTHPDLDDEATTLKVPIIFRGHPLGSIKLKKDSEQSVWSHEEIQMVNTIVAQFSLALENARLLEESQRRAERERRISEITARIRGSNDPQIILETAATELRNALGVTQTQILLNPQPEMKKTVSGGNGHTILPGKSIGIQERDNGQTHPPEQEIE